MEYLQKLNLCRCLLTGEDVKHIAVSLRNMPNLVNLKLSSNATLSGSGAYWSDLKEMKHLRKLLLHKCSLTGEDLKHITVSLSSMPNLVHLALSGNETLVGLRASWSHLKEMKHVRELDLSDSSLTGGDLKHIAVTLGSMPNLVKLNLFANETLGGSDASWSHLKEMKHLEKLVLGYCSLTDEDLKEIAVSLSNMPNLVKLDLSGNETLVGLRASWFHLKGMKYVRKLHLGNCLLTGQDVKHIALSVGSMPNLVELALSSNDTLSGSGAAWSHLKVMEYLRKLHLADCSLTGEDLKHIAASVSGMTNLVELDLSENTLGDSVVWSQLPRMIYLKTLSLKNCRLTPVDKLHIEEAQSAMSNLVEVEY